MKKENDGVILHFCKQWWILVDNRNTHLPMSVCVCVCFKVRAPEVVREMKSLFKGKTVERAEAAEAAHTVHDICVFPPSDSQQCHPVCVCDQ